MAERGTSAGAHGGGGNNGGDGGIAGSAAIEAPLRLRGPEATLHLRAPGDAPLGGEAGGGGSTSQEESSALPISKTKPKRETVAKRVATYDEHGSSESDSSEHSSDDEATRERERSPQSSNASTSPSAPARASDVMAPRWARSRLPQMSTMGSLIADGTKHLEQGQRITSLEQLRSADTLYDIDGYCAVFAGDTALDAVLHRLDGSRRPIHPIGAEWAEARQLYDPNTFAVASLSQPERRHGSIWCISRNKYNLSLKDVGKQITMPLELPGGGTTVTCTTELVDSGLHAMHRSLTDESRGHHFSVKGLERLEAGSHGIWCTHNQIMEYKLVAAVKHCGLKLLICDFGQKSKCVRDLRIALLRAQRMSPAQRPGVGRSSTILRLLLLSRAPLSSPPLGAHRSSCLSPMCVRVRSL